DKLLDGFGELMRTISLKFVPTAILSRQIAGVRGRTLIVNLPGKPSAIRDCLLAVFPAIPYCIDLLEGPCLTTHESVVKAFRPKTPERNMKWPGKVGGKMVRGMVRHQGGGAKGADAPSRRPSAQRFPFPGTVVLGGV